MLKPIEVRNDKISYLWTKELCEENIGVIWNEEYAHYILRCVKYCMDNKIEV